MENLKNEEKWNKNGGRKWGKMKKMKKWGMGKEMGKNEKNEENKG